MNESLPAAAKPAMTAEEMVVVLLEEIRSLKAELETYRKLIFGQKSEKRTQTNNLLQGDLQPIDEGVPPVFEGLSTPQEASESKAAMPPPPARTKAARGQAKRKPLAASLERQIVKVPDPANLICPITGKAMVVVEVEKIEKLAIIPARAIVYVYERNIFASPGGQGHFVRSPLPAAATVIPNSQSHVSVLAHTLVQKFVDHMPFYRQEVAHARNGVELSRSTLCDQSRKCSELLTPVYQAMVRNLVAESYLQSDDTAVDVMDPNRPGQVRPARIWTYGRPGGEVVFDFQPGRGNEHPAKFLKDFQGKLQTDAYAGYQLLLDDNPAIIAFGCMAHARRKFFEASSEEKEKTTEVLNLIGKLYELEAQAREAHLNAKERGLLRKQNAPVMLKELKAIVDVEHPQILPKSAFGKAITYIHNQWDSLVRYVEHGEVEIDNNLMENALRPIALGRKNWLFVGSMEAGPSCAIHYSITASCKRLGINPYDYYCDVLPKLGTTLNKLIDTLTPSGWLKAKQV